MIEIQYEDYSGLITYIVRNILSTDIAGTLNNPQERQDLIQAGSTALLEAAQRFNPDRGVPFAAYAAICIRGQILDALGKSNPTPRGIRDQLRDIQRATQKLEQKLGRPPAEHEVASALDISVEKFRAIVQGAVHLVSIDDEIDKISSTNNPEGDLLGREHAQIAAACVDALPRDMKQIVILGVYEDLGPKEISRLIHRPLSTIYRWRERAYKALKRCLQRKGWVTAGQI